MIAAYVIGYSITPRYLSQNPFLKFATGANDTGVIVSWNTEAPTVEGTNPVLLPGGLAINPITWTRTQTEATAKQNLGSIELNPATGTPVLNNNGTVKRVMGLADARVNKAKGVVICSTVNAANPPYYTPGGFPMGVLHPFDYPALLLRHQSERRQPGRALLRQAVEGSLERLCRWSGGFSLSFSREGERGGAYLSESSRCRESRHVHERGA